MDHRIYQLQNHPLTLVKQKKAISNSPVKSFKDELSQATSPLKLSKHATQRLDERKIDIPPNRWREIEQKVAEAKSKGVKDSLVLMNNAALIVSTTNNTVITAMNRDEAHSQIFTNINGTILID